MIRSQASTYYPGRSFCLLPVCSPWLCSIQGYIYRMCTSSTIRYRKLMSVSFIKVCNHCNAIFLSSCQWSLHWQQFYAMFIKRAMFSWRNWSLLLMQILGLLGIVYFLMKGVEISRNKIEPAREMDLEQYGQTTVLFSDDSHSDFSQNLTKILDIMLKAKKQKLQEVKGKVLSERKRLLIDENLLVSLPKRGPNWNIIALFFLETH